MKKVCFIGVGGAAANIMDQLTFEYHGLIKYEDKLTFEYGYISTAIEEIHRVQDFGIDIIHNDEIHSMIDMFEPIINRKITRKINYIGAGEYICRGLGCGSDTDKGIKSYEESKKNIEKFLKQLTEGADLVITFAGIGGGCGTGMTPLVNNYIKSLGIPIVTFIQKAFEFEGKRRRDEKFDENIKLFENSADEVIVIDTKNVRLDKDNKISIMSLFKETDIYSTKQIIGYLDKYIIK